MRRRLVLAPLSVLVVAACGSGSGERCEWQPNGNPSRLDIRDRSQRLHLFQRLPADVPRIRSVATAVTACAAGVGGLALFGLYSAVYEMARVGNTHMSYRVDRHPWHRHQGELLVAGIMVFALVALFRHARDRAEQGESETIEHG